MQTQVLILSADAVFARMLAIELEMQGITALCAAEANKTKDAEIVLIDLDTAMPPEQTQYRNMIGFTRSSATAGEEAGRLCSLVLHRPFEMRLFREEMRNLISEANRNTAVETGLVLETTFVRLADGKEVLLSPKEREVLALLMEAEGMPVSRESIAERIGESSANKAEVYICYLRKKLETPERRLIETVRGKGYRLV